ncbi:MAG: DUF2934 domain-containing protein, partial [Phycisphaerae bacterium]
SPFPKEDHAMSRHSKWKMQEVRSDRPHAVRAELPTVTEEQIRRRAYELWLARGRKPGDPVRDWLQAERELKAALAPH